MEFDLVSSRNKADFITNIALSSFLKFLVVLTSFAVKIKAWLENEEGKPFSLQLLFDLDVLLILYVFLLLLLLDVSPEFRKQKSSRAGTKPCL